MARLPRIVLPEYPLHIMHRGNNRQDIFESEDDMVKMKEDIAVSLKKSTCDLHAYVIMSNHIHLLVTPKNKNELGKFMQSMANRYVRYFNAMRKRTGTIWEGRFKSCLVDSDHYLFSLYKYIEMNPVKAGIVENVADYLWSSYHHNALGLADELITEHDLFKGLSRDQKQRHICYRKMFEDHNILKHEQLISNATFRGEVLGNESFHQKIGKLVSRSTRLGSHGGDRKSEAYNNQTG